MSVSVVDCLYRDPEYQMVYYHTDDIDNPPADECERFFSTYDYPDYPTYEFGDDDYEFEPECDNNVSRMPRLETIPELDEPEISSCSSSLSYYEEEYAESTNHEEGHKESLGAVSHCEHLPSKSSDMLSKNNEKDDLIEDNHTHQASSKPPQKESLVMEIHSDSLEGLSDEDEEDDPNAITLPGSQLPGFEKIGARVAGKKLPESLENGHCKFQKGSISSHRFYLSLWSWMRQWLVQSPNYMPWWSCFTPPQLFLSIHICYHNAKCCFSYTDTVTLSFYIEATGHIKCICMLDNFLNIMELNVFIFQHGKNGFPWLLYQIHL